jgi:hypothetical protein
MSLVRCTQKLLKELRVKPTEVDLGLDISANGMQICCGLKEEKVYCSQITIRFIQYLSLA